MRDIWRNFGAELLWVTIPCLLVLAFSVSRLRRSTGSRSYNVQVTARALLVVIAVVAGAMLFSPVTRTTHARFLDLHLLTTLRSSFENHIMFAQMAGNLLLLCWLGFLLPIAFRPVRPWTAVLIAAAASVGIETVQYLIAVGRVSSISDVFFNTVGAAAGAVAAKVLRNRLLGLPPRPVAPASEYDTVPF